MLSFLSPSGRGSGFDQAVPALVLLLAFFVVPVAALLSRSVTEPQLGLQNYLALLGSSTYLRIFLNTFLVSGVVTLITALIAFPVAWLLAICTPLMARLLFSVILLSMWTNLLARTYAWMVLLQQTGLINRMLMASGLIEKPLQLTNNLVGVTIGMVYIMLPFMILPLYGVIKKIDPAILQAAALCGATKGQALRRVLLPLAMPGIASGALMVFVMSLGYFVTPSLLGGTANMMLAELIVQQVQSLVNWGMGGAAAFILLVVTLAIYALQLRLLSRGERLMLMNFDKLGAWRWILGGIATLMALFLLLPILFIVALSFGSSRWLIFPPPSWTTKWYHDLFADPRWLQAAWTSAKIGVVVMILSVAFGLLASIALTRGTFKGREVLRAFFLTPMVLPVVIIAVALYAAFLRLGLNGTFIGFVIAHLIVALPFAIITICGALETFDPAIEDAAILCGASPWEARFRVTLPAISHGLFSAAIFSFLISWDEVVLAIFMASPTLQTLPVKVWTTLRQDLTPVIAAASSLLVLLTVILMIAAALIRKGKAK